MSATTSTPSSPLPSSSTSNSSSPAVRLVLQRVNSASLLVDNISRRVSMQKGIVCHLAFFDGANENHILKAVKLITESKLFAFEFPPPPPSYNNNKNNNNDNDDQKEETKNVSSAVVVNARPKPISLLDDATINLMIVPQASIAGRIKGKVAQYHAQCAKDQAQDLYTLFISSLRKILLPVVAEGILDQNGEVILGDEEEKKINLPRKVLNGSYGNIQALNLDSPGPMTHVLDVDL
jgi:D-Tyr-tRNAtyr deacylase